MPWWIDETETEPIAMNIRLWSTLPSQDRNELKVQMLILFPEVVKSDYRNAAMWLASAKGVVNPSFRDVFTAVGKVYVVDGKTIETGLPKIWKTVSCLYETVRKFLGKNSPIIPYIREYNSGLIGSRDMNRKWLEQIESLLPSQTINRKKYSISEVLRNGTLLE